MIHHKAKLVIEPIETPVSMRSALVSFGAGRLPAILESSRVTDNYGRYSVLACDPAAVVIIQADADYDGDIASRLEKAFGRWPSLECTSTELPICVGWIGFLTYEAGLPVAGLSPRNNSQASKPLRQKASALHAIAEAPLAQFCLYDHAAIYDGWLQRWYAVAVDWPANTPTSRPSVTHRLAALRDLLSSDTDNHYNNIHHNNTHQIGQDTAQFDQYTTQEGQYTTQDDLATPASPLTKGGLRGVSSTVESIKPTISASMTRDQYFQLFNKAMQHIEAGDIYEVNLAIRFEAQTALSPIEQYLRLRDSSPSTNAAFIPWNDNAILSTSPELFLELRNGRVITRPIKGTRARAGDLATDEESKQDLVHSEKDRAELTMIVDLMRNDLGRVCEYGSVRVLEAAAIESLPTVYQQVATIEGRLSKQYAWPDLLRATFPGGSITGAPKIRAMQIIDELEPVAREVYCGSIGIIGLDGSMSLNIAIRTMVQEGNRVKFWAGGAIVADSEPQAEYDEILTKTVGLRRALVGVQAQESASA